MSEKTEMTVEVLSEQEVRVLGSLIEKERTTPEYYPLTLNALVNACNQKSNRSPVVLYTHADVARVVDALRWKGWIIVVDEAGSRAEKYRHRFREKTSLGEKETAVLTELMLRGAQTAGELRGRASRMASFAGLEETQEILRALEERENPWVVRLPRQQGFKERRFRHLLSGEVAIAAEDAGETEERGRSGGVPEAPKLEKLEKLEAELASLRERVETLEGALEELRSRVE
jgi:hypothetical protein